ncbi:hypothetical protein L3X38_028802 [Prunus dulcis]|uniref:Agglutinin domain-containing protein n=1 Tax=Prunus dulcis TaxID=3755 RepID=A0AAD4VQG5_PRUDU|nr:hypothetical protein L3X38_028802 [Prunus dulcis]
MAIPTGSLALKSVTLERYVVYIHKEVYPLNDVLECSGQDPESADATFQVAADAQDASLVNIKSSNGKYWRRADNESSWIVSDAVEIHEDQDSWECTLFRPVKVDDDPQNNRYRFQHVQLGYYIQPVAKWEGELILNAYQEATDDDQIFEVISKETQTL